MERFWPHDDQLIQQILDWSYRRIIAGQDPMSGAKTADDLRQATGATVTPSGIGGSEALRLFSQELIPATRAQGDAMNLAYIPAAPTEASLVFDLAISASEVFAGTWESGAGFVHGENEALAWLTSVLGWPEAAGGCFVSGATVGNLSALVAAREKAGTERDRPARWRFAATGDAHSSVDAAAKVMDCEILRVPGDERGALTGPALRAALEAEGHEDVFAVVASAGTTNAGVIDDLAGLADVCEEYGLWLHVDGAYGGAGLIAPSVRHRFDGIERADSFVVDPHKWLFAGYDCCALIYRDPGWATAAHAQHANYLGLIDREAWNPADYAIHLSRRARGMPFWFSLATYGTDYYTRAVEAVLDLTRAVATRSTDSTS